MKKIIIMILAIACMITVLNSCRDKTGEEVMNTEESEPPTEAPSETEAETEPTTEPATETPTETPTEAPTEAPTESPTEPPTEAPTEPEIEFTIKGRETMLEGQPVEFDLGYSNYWQSPKGSICTPRKADSNLCESLCSIWGFSSCAGVISPSSTINWQPLQTPSDRVSGRA